MIVQCPHCGQSVVIKGLGRKSLDIPLINVCDALRRTSSVNLAAGVEVQRGIHFQSAQGQWAETQRCR